MDDSDPRSRVRHDLIAEIQRRLAHLTVSTEHTLEQKETIARSVLQVLLEEDGDGISYIATGSR